MFGIGWQEILLILVVAVLVIGPDQLPQVARTVGRTIAQFRRLSNELRDTVNREFTENEDFREFREFGKTFDAEFRDISKVAKNYVEKEIAAEEEELGRFAEEVRNAGKTVAEEGKHLVEAGKESLDEGADAANESGEAAAEPAEPTANADDAQASDEPPVNTTARAGFEPPADSHAYVPDEAKPGADDATAASDASANGAASAKEPETEAAKDGAAHKETA